MQKIGDFWVPQGDLSRWKKWGKQRRKTLAYYGGGDGPKSDDILETLAIIGGGRVAVDGGAHIGAYTRLMLRHFEFVHAFEPTPDTFEALQRNIEDWGLANRVRLYPIALSDRKHKVQMRGRLGRRSTTTRVVGDGDILACPIDSLDLGPVDFIKLDLEGYEVRALTGARRTLEKYRPYVLFEDKPERSAAYGQPRAAHEFLESLGARMVSHVGRNDCLFAFPQT
jgi:FkbM family methyltransferase